MGTIRTGWVSLDGFVPVLAQWNDSTRWNGWLCPRIDPLSVVKVLETINRDAGELRYRYDWDDNGDLLLFELDDSEQYLEVLEADSDGLYALGSHAWTWSEERRILGTFNAVVTRGSAALARDGEPFEDLNPVPESDSSGLGEGGDLFEVQFTDGSWMLVRAADLTSLRP